MNRRCCRVTTVAIIIATVATIAAFLLSMHALGWLKHLWAPAAAAWAQAIFTVAAIGVAIEVPRRQALAFERRERRRQAEAVIHLAEMAKMIADKAVFSVVTFCEEAEAQGHGERFQPRQELLKSARKQMDLLLVRGFDEPKLTEVFKHITNLRKRLDFCFDTLNLCQEQVWSNDLLVRSRAPSRAQEARDDYSKVLLAADGAISEVREQEARRGPT